MLNSTLRYDKMVEKALRGVITQALQHVIKNGLPEDHHFYITFITDFPGVQIPPYLQEQYPEEMTIVLQYQFYGLEADEERMAVTLSFNNVPERLIVPIDAITIFADPAVNFALQFQPMEDMEDIMDEDDLMPPPPPPRSPKGPGKKTTDKADKGSKDTKADNGKVISIDSFRKK